VSAETILYDEKHEKWKYTASVTPTC